MRRSCSGINDMLRIGFLLCLCCLQVWPQQSLDSLVAPAERYEKKANGKTRPRPISKSSK